VVFSPLSAGGRCGELPFWRRRLARTRRGLRTFLETGGALEERMQTLERLRSQGLVDEDEYADQRRRLLNEI
jgi:hypothetical protein